MASAVVDLRPTGGVERGAKAPRGARPGSSSGHPNAPPRRRRLRGPCAGRSDEAETAPKHAKPMLQDYADADGCTDACLHMCACMDNPT